MPVLRFASPERRWRAASAPLIAGLAGWLATWSIRLSRPAAQPLMLPLTWRVAVTCGAFAAGGAIGVLVMRTHLAVTAEGVADHRVLRTVRVPWQRITGFEINRPGGLWGGICLQAVCHDLETVDLLSTRAYSRVPSGEHLDQLELIRWSLEEAARRYSA